MMTILANRWDGTEESAQWTNSAINAVIDTLVNADMWTGDPPYRGKTPAEQVQMLVDEVRSLRAKLDAVQACVDVRHYPADAERVPMNVHPAVVAELHKWLMAQAPSGEGYSEFIAKALAWRRLMAGEVQP